MAPGFSFEITILGNIIEILDSICKNILLWRYFLVGHKWRHDFEGGEGQEFYDDNIQF